MGWLRLVGCLNLYESFAEYSLFCRAFWQKRPIILRGLRIIAVITSRDDTRATRAYTFYLFMEIKGVRIHTRARHLSGLYKWFICIRPHFISQKNVRGEIGGWGRVPPVMEI